MAGEVEVECWRVQNFQVAGGSRSGMSEVADSGRVAQFCLHSLSPPQRPLVYHFSRYFQELLMRSHGLDSAQINISTLPLQISCCKTTNPTSTRYFQDLIFYVRSNIASRSVCLLSVLICWTFTFARIFNQSYRMQSLEQVSQ